jgi:hypothetical protein
MLLLLLLLLLVSPIDLRRVLIILITGNCIQNKLLLRRLLLDGTTGSGSTLLGLDEKCAVVVDSLALRATRFCQVYGFFFCWKIWGVNRKYMPNALTDTPSNPTRRQTKAAFLLFPLFYKCLLTALDSALATMVACLGDTAPFVGSCRPPVGSSRGRSRGRVGTAF